MDVYVRPTGEDLGRIANAIDELIAATKIPGGVTVTLRGMVQGMDDMAGGGKVIKAEVPLSEMFGYSTTLRSMSQGRATYTMEFKHYSEAPKNVADAIITARGK